jgi:hypothetical protein
MSRDLLPSLYHRDPECDLAAYVDLFLGAIGVVERDEPAQEPA